jgi:regulator of protease activity HflC (stomatin/prohibitin superfamily)
MLANIIVIAGGFLGGLLGGIIGSVFGYFGTGFISGAMLWGFTYLAIGLTIVPQQEVWVIERLGKFCRILRPGVSFLCLPGVIDKIRTNESMKLRRIDLYDDEAGNEMDFEDGSAPIKAQVWFNIGEEDGDIEKFVYEVTNPKMWIEERFDDYIRPLLQHLTIDDAQKQKNQIATEASNALRDSVKEITGAILDKSKGLLITDIVLSKETKEARAKRLEGQTEAEKSIKVGEGYIKAILAIVKEAKKAKAPITFDQAAEIYEKQRGLETIGRTGANVTFVAPDIKGVLKTVNIGTRGKGGNS